MENQGKKRKYRDYIEWDENQEHRLRDAERKKQKERKGNRETKQSLYVK